MRRLLAVGMMLLVWGSAAVYAAPVVPPGARVAVCGDSITEQKQYSRFIEVYLLACMPQLQTTNMQFGWSGDWARGFNGRYVHDMMPFKPTVVTTCYGMNDGSYRPFEASIGKNYEDPMRSLVSGLKAAGVTVVVGGPGAVDSFTWRNDPAQAVAYNDSLGKLSEIAHTIATENGMPFANVHDTMMEVMAKAKAALGNPYHVGGGDGVHPSANGHLVMAYAFLKAMGFDGDLGTIAVDMKGPSSATGGHQLLGGANGQADVESSRYPFCFFGSANDPNGTASILPFLPFNQDLNRLTLVVKNLDAAQGKVTWGDQSKTFAQADLEKGINLAAEFLNNPFVAAFRNLDNAVGQKENFETYLVKSIVSQDPWLLGMFKDDADFPAISQAYQAKLWTRQAQYCDQVRAQVTPVKHTLTVTAD